MKLTAAAIAGLLLTGTSIATAQQPLSAKVQALLPAKTQPALPGKADASPAAAMQTPVATTTQAQFTSPQFLAPPPVTPELWVYSQEQRRHDDPAQAVRRKAELKAEQRMSRLAAMHWYGLSNSRPVASPVPFMSEYSPAWRGNGWNRFDWAAVSSPSIFLQVDPYGFLR